MYGLRNFFIRIEDPRLSLEIVKVRNLKILETQLNKLFKVLKIKYRI